MASSLLTGIKSYWKLDDTSGKARDELGRLPMTTSAVRGVAGKINTAYEFGTSFWGNRMWTSDPIGLTDWSLSFWVYKDSTSSTRQILFSIGEGSLITLIIDVDSKLKWTFGGNTYILDNTVIPTNQFVHIVVVYDTGNRTNPIYDLTTYVNNVEKSVTNLPMRFGNSRLHFGAGTSPEGIGTSNPFKGKLDEIGLWVKPITSDEVSDLYNGGSGHEFPFEVLENESESGGGTEVQPVYGEKYFVTHYISTDTTQTIYRIEIRELNYTGPPTEIRTHGDVFRHVYEGINSENAFEKVAQSARLELDILIQTDDELNILEDIFEADEQQFQLIKKVNGSIEWRGYVQPGLLEYDEAPLPITGVIIAKDISLLNAKYYPLRTSDEYKKAIILIAEILKELQYFIDIHVYTDWSTEDIDETECMLDQLYHNAYHLRIYGENEETDTAITLYDAISYMIKPYGLIVRQQNNAWELININYIARSGGVVMRYEFDYNGIPINSASVQVDLRTNVDNTDKFPLDTSRNRFITPVKTINFRYHHKSNVKGLRLNEVIQSSGAAINAGSLAVDDLENNEGITFSIAAEVNVGVINTSMQTTAYFTIKTDTHYYNIETDEWQLDPYQISFLCNYSRGSLVGSENGPRRGTTPIPSEFNSDSSVIPSEGDVQIILEYVDTPISGQDVNFVTWTISMNLSTSGSPENQYNTYRITQLKTFSRIKDIGSSIYGVAPVSSYKAYRTPGEDNTEFVVHTRSGILYQKTVVEKEISKENFYRADINDSSGGTLESYDPLALVLIELMELFRLSVRSIDFNLLGAAMPYQILNYRSNLYFCLSGTQIGRENKWTSSNFMKLQATPEGTDVIEILTRTESEAGGANGGGGGSSSGGAGSTIIDINLELKADKDGGDQQMFYYPANIDSTSIFVDLLTDERLFLKLSLDRLASLVLDLIETKVDEDGGDAFMLYYPEDDDNVTGFFAGLLTGGAVSARNAWDRIVSYVKNISLDSNFSGFNINIDDVNTYDLNIAEATSGNNAPTGWYLESVPNLRPVMFVDGVMVVYGDGVKTEDWYFGTEDSADVITAVAFANLVGDEQVYWNGTNNANRGHTIVFGDLQTYNSVSFLHAGITVDVPSWDSVSASASASASASEPDAAHELILSTNPYAYLRFNETSGTTANDETSNNNDFTFVDTPTLAQPGVIPNDWGTCISTVGNSGYVRRTRATIIHGTSSENIGIYMVVSRLQLASGVVLVGFGSTSDADSKLALRLIESGSFNNLELTYVSNGGTTRNSVGSFVFNNDTDDVYRIYLEWTPGTSTFAVYVNEFTTPDIGVDNAPAFACNTTDIAIAGIYKETGAGAGLENHCEAKFDNFVIWFGTLPALSTIDEIDTLYGF